MLNRLASLPTFLRLSLCVLLSTGVHAAAVLYDGIEPLVALSENGAPVTVALLSVDDPSEFRPAVKPLQKAPIPVMEPEPIIAKTVVSEQVRPVQKPVQVVKTSPQPERQVVAETAPADEKMPAKDIVCVESKMKEAEETTTDKMSSSSANNEETAPVKVVASNSAADAAQKLSSAGGQNGSRHDLIEAVPKYRLNPKPEYPAIAAKRRWEGVVWLLVEVSAEGLVKDLQVEQTCGYGVLDRAARKSVKRWEFVPAMRAGLPVESQVRIPIRFRLEDS